MKMRLQSMSPFAFALTFGLFVVLLIGSIAIGAFGPNITGSTSVSTWNCTDSSQSYYDPTVCSGVNILAENMFWTGQIDNLTALNQRLILIVHAKNAKKDTESVDMDITFTTTMEGSNDPEDSGSWTMIAEEEETTRDLSCDKGDSGCTDINLVHEPFLSYEAYRFIISAHVEDHTAVGDIVFEFEYVDHLFTIFELWFRAVFLVGTSVMLILVIYLLRRYTWSEWTVEQKWTLILLFGLVLYNNPIYASELLVDSWLPVFLDQVFVTSCLALLLLFWLVMLDGIVKYQPGARGCLMFYAPKAFLIGLIWIAVVTLFTWQELHEVDDPEYDSVYDIPHFIAFQLLLAGLMLVYVLWIAYVLVRGLASSKHLPYVGRRIKFFGIFTLAVMLLVAGSLAFTFLGPVHNNAAELLSYLALLNLYVWVLAAVYLPTKTSPVDADDVNDLVGMVTLEGTADYAELDGHLPEAYRESEGDEEMQEYPTLDSSSEE